MRLGTGWMVFMLKAFYRNMTVYIKFFDDELFISIACNINLQILFIESLDLIDVTV